MATEPRPVTMSTALHDTATATATVTTTTSGSAISHDTSVLAINDRSTTAAAGTTTPLPATTPMVLASHSCRGRPITVHRRRAVTVGMVLLVLLMLLMLLMLLVLLLATSGTVGRRRQHGGTDASASPAVGLAPAQRGGRPAVYPLFPPSRPI